MRHSGMARRLSVALVLVSVLIVILVFFVLREKHTGQLPILDPDPSQNEAYATYQYGEPDTIYIGTQPLYAPTGLITEAMRRDRILGASLDKLGLDVIYHSYLKGYDVGFFLRRGDLHVGVGGDMPTLSIAATARVVIPVMIQSGPTWLITRVGILPNELEGKRIAYSYGSNAHFMLLNLLSSYGLSEADVDLVPMDVNKMIEAMVREDIFAFAAWEPTASLAVLQHSYVANYGVLSSGYLYFSEDFADAYPRAIREIIAAEIRAIQWMQDSRDNLRRASEWAIEAAETLTGETLPLSSEQYAFIAERDILGSDAKASVAIRANSIAEGGRLQAEYLFLQDLNKVPVESRWEDVYESFDLTILSDVLDNALEYRLLDAQYVTDPAGPLTQP